jgi:hypothetical protein
MTEQEQKVALQKTIQSFKYYMKNADHEEPATLNLIIDDELNDIEIEFIVDLVNDYESFEVFDFDGEEVFLTTDQLDEMINDLENHLESF